MSEWQPEVELGTWDALGTDALALRMEVFVREQGVPEELEPDANDPLSLHALVRDREGRAIATGRLLPDGHVGRMAVRRDWRGKGIGGVVLRRLIALARERGIAQALLHSQVVAQGFYASEGFRPVGEVFMEAGIPHRLMVLDLKRG